MFAQKIIDTSLNVPTVAISKLNGALKAQNGTATSPDTPAKDASDDPMNLNDIKQPAAPALRTTSPTPNNSLSAAQLQDRMRLAELELKREEAKMAAQREEVAIAERKAALQVQQQKKTEEHVERLMTLCKSQPELCATTLKSTA